MQESKNMPQKNLRKGDKRERAHSKGNCTGERGEALESMQETESTGEGGEGPHARQRGDMHNRGEHKESKEKCLGGNGTLCETGIERKVPGMMQGEHARVGNCTQSRREEDRRERGEDSMCAGESMQERRYIQEGKNEMLTKPETEKV